MRRTLLLSLAFVIGGTATVSAQGFGYRYGGVAAYRFGPRGVVGFRAGGFGGGFFVNPYGVTTIRQVNVIYAPPPYILPPIIFTPPPVRVEVPVVINQPAPPPPVREREADREAPPERPLPGQPAGVFRPLAPDNRERAERPAGKPQVRPAEPPLPLDPDAPAPIPPAPAPARPVPPAAPLPAQEIDRLIMLGRNAFVMEEFGRAAEFFRRAASSAPGDGLPLLLLGQALFALGKYVDAYDAVAAGVPLRPNWPVAPESPRALYGPPPTEHRGHLERLEQTLARHPRDGVLLFLYGYQLWIDGRRDDARPHFERAKEQGVPAELVDRFLLAAPPGRVL